MEDKTIEIVILATITEAVTEYLFSDIPLFERHIKKLSLIVGVAMALIFGADVFVLLGMQAVSPILGQIVTGILISRGSNLINTIIDSTHARLKGKV